MFGTYFDFEISFLVILPKHTIWEICQSLDSVMFDVAIDVASGVDSKHIWTNKYTLKTSQVLTLIYIQVC